MLRQESAGSDFADECFPPPPPPVTISAFGEDLQRSPPPPGRWDYFVSHAQKETGVFAEGLFHALREKGKSVWLDVKMDTCDEAAMENGVHGAAVVLVIVSESYFKREFCLKELRWAVQSETPLVVAIPVDLRTKIGEILATCPGDLRKIGSIQFITIDRGSPDDWAFSVGKIMKADPKRLDAAPLLPSPRESDTNRKSDDLTIDAERQASRDSETSRADASTSITGLQNKLSSKDLVGKTVDIEGIGEAQVIDFKKSYGLSRSKHVVRLKSDGSQKEVVLRRAKFGIEGGSPYKVVDEYDYPYERDQAARAGFEIDEESEIAAVMDDENASDDGDAEEESHSGRARRSETVVQGTYTERMSASLSVTRKLLKLVNESRQEVLVYVANAEASLKLIKNDDGSYTFQGSTWQKTRLKSGQKKAMTVKAGSYVSILFLSPDDGRYKHAIENRFVEIADTFTVYDRHLTSEIPFKDSTTDP